MQHYVASPTSHKLPMALLACVPQIPYRPTWCTLASWRLQGFKMKPIAAPLALPMRGKMHCFLALQLKQVDTSVVTEDYKIVRYKFHYTSQYLKGLTHTTPENPEQTGTKPRRQYHSSTACC